jgi:hypothetical protein
MTDKAWHRHPLVVGLVIAALTGGAAWWTDFDFGAAWTVMTGAGTKVLQWFASSAEIPRWLIVVVVLLVVAAGALMVRAVARKWAAEAAADNKFYGGPPSIPGELQAFNMVWRWRWRPDGMPGTPQPFCATCDMQLVPAMNRSWQFGQYGAVIYYCHDCGAEQHRSELSRDYIPTGPQTQHQALQQHVVLAAQREMRRQLRGGD